MCNEKEPIKSYERQPSSATFELTVRCNLKCKMCLFRHDDRENQMLMEQELTAEQWGDIAKQTADMGVVELLVTGGEPMLRTDFCDIWEKIYKMGFIIELYTNATIVTPAIMETLKKYPPHRIGITIYGASSETYEKVCGNSSAYEHMINGVYLLQTLPSAIEFRTTIIQDNYSDINAIEEMVKEVFHSELPVCCAVTVNKAVRGACANVEQCRLDPETELQLHLDRKLQLIKKFIGDDYDERRVGVRDNTISLVTKERAPVLGCPAGRHTFTISYDGNLMACQMLGCFQTDVKLLGLKEAWVKLPEQMVLPPVSQACKKCDVSEYCHSCYATRYAETGTLDGCSDYLYKSAFSEKKLESRYRR